MTGHVLCASGINPIEN